MIEVSQYNSPVGKIMIACRDNAIKGLWIDGQKYYMNSIKEEVRENETPVLIQTKEWLNRYFDGERPEVGSLPLSPDGSEFRRLVWTILCEIPYGKTATYGDIAKEAAKRMCKERMSAQAIGGAVGHNPISVIIPCHRVVGTDGSLTGYAGGISVKLKLLTHEGVDAKRLYIPENGTAL